MKELKILAVVVVFTGILYFGVEPFAHGQMHKHVEGNHFVYDGKTDQKVIEEQLEEESKQDKPDQDRIKALKASAEMKKAFWADVKKISALKGDPVAGEATFAMCASCHIEGGSVNMGGVTPPSLAHVGALYDKDFLIALIKDPAIATSVEHKFPNGTMSHPMGSVASMIPNPQDIANVVAYMKTKKAGEVTPKEAYVEACGRCHANRYGKLTQLGDIPKTKSNIKTGQDIDALKYQQKVAEEQGLLADYLGKLPPDLSIMIRARSEHFLETFVENPQLHLYGTAMPRVGLTTEGYEKVKEYLTETGDPSKKAREAIGPFVLLFFVVFTVLAYLWKKEKWRDH
ncbi:MAG: cytochrome c1 [Campylobacterales bacterium]|nr:cytochrome c1 [Campylobacterales bacterium]